MPPDGFFRFLQDFGEEWVAWTPESATREPALAQAVARFESRDNPAGIRSTEWLRDEALNNHPSTVTHLLLADGRVEGFFALCSGTAKLSQRHRRELRHGEHEHLLLPRQPVAHVAWMAKDRRATITGAELLAQAIGVALEVVEFGQGQIAISLDAYDEETADMWQRRFGFRRSQPLDGRISLWRTIMSNPEEDPREDDASEDEER